MAQADEIFITSTAGGIMPVTDYEGRVLPVGPVTQRLHELYWRRHEDPAYTTPVPYAD